MRIHHIRVGLVWMRVGNAHKSVRENSGLLGGNTNLDTSNEQNEKTQNLHRLEHSFVLW